MDDEILGMAHVLGHSETAFCQLCGRPTPVTSLRQESVDRGDGSGATELLEICPSCQEALAAGTAPIDLMPGSGLEDVSS